MTKSSWQVTDHLANPFYLFKKQTNHQQLPNCDFANSFCKIRMCKKLFSEQGITRLQNKNEGTGAGRTILMIWQTIGKICHSLLEIRVTNEYQRASALCQPKKLGFGVHTLSPKDPKFSSQPEPLAVWPFLML